MIISRSDSLLCKAKVDTSVFLDTSVLSMLTWLWADTVFEQLSIWKRILIVRKALKAVAFSSFARHCHKVASLPPACCCMELMRKVDVTPSWACIVKRIMAVPDERSSFFFLGRFLTPTILVFTQLVQIESVNAEISKDSRAGVRKAELHLYCMSQLRVHIICFLSFLAWWWWWWWWRLGW